MAKQNLFSTYYRNEALVECKPISCFVCNQPMQRFDQNRFKVILTCAICSITIQMRTNETILYKGEVNITEIPEQPVNSEEWLKNRDPLYMEQIDPNAFNCVNCKRILLNKAIGDCFHFKMKCPRCKAKFVINKDR